MSLSERVRSGYVTRLVLALAALGLDVVVIGGGFAAALSSGTAGWLWFALGSVAYLGLVVLLVRSMPRSASFGSQRAAAVFTKLRNLTVVLWSVYPAVWVTSVAGLGLLQPASEVLVTAYLDLITKVGFAVIAVNGRDALGDASTGTATDAGGAGTGPADD